jgi:hypothetical protein
MLVPPLHHHLSIIFESILGMNEIDVCCADCGMNGGASLKTCTSCKIVKYCNADCQRNHWLQHKKICKRRAAELRDEALFKDPPPKEDCPICFLPMPIRLISCITLTPATILAVPIDDFVIANEGSAKMCTYEYYSCCGKSIYNGCLYSVCKSGNIEKCPFCKADHVDKTDEERIKELMKRIEAKDAGAMCQLANYYYIGINGLQQDGQKATELWKHAVEIGSSHAHNNLADMFCQGGDLKKAKFHYEAAAMAGHEGARYNLGTMENDSRNLEQAIKHWMIGASAGDYTAMNALRKYFEIGVVTQESIESILTEYNNSCVEMRSKARDTYIRMCIDRKRKALNT